jgi:hypothetical protein
MANVGFNLPVKGFSEGMPVDKADPLTSGHMRNVRARGPRIRIIQRPGITHWGAGTLIGGEEQPVVAIITVSTVL